MQFKRAAMDDIERQLRRRAYFAEAKQLRATVELARRGVMASTRSIADFAPHRRLSGDLTLAWTAAFDALNAGEFNLLKVEPVQHTISGQLPKLKATAWGIEGYLGGSILNIDPGAGDLGQFIELGDSELAAIRFSIRGLTLRCLNTPNPAHFAIKTVRATEGVIEYIRASNWAGAISNGAPGLNGIRMLYQHIHGTINSGGESDANILVTRASNVKFFDIVLSGNAASANENGALIRLKPDADTEDIIDTVVGIGVQMQIKSVVNPPEDADGKAIALEMDDSAGTITNQWWDKCSLDHTRRKGFYWKNTRDPESDPLDPTGERASRNVHVYHCRFATNAGIPFHIERNPRYEQIRAFDIADNFFQSAGSASGPLATDAPIALIEGGGAEGCHFHHNQLLTKQPTYIRSVGIQFEGDGWTIDHNTIASNVTDNAGVLIGIKTTNADLVNFRIGHNSMGDGVTTPYSFPAWTTPSAKRIIGVFSEVEDYASLPAAGDPTVAYITADSKKFWRWRLDGSGYDEISPLADGDKGDITVSGSGATWTIDPNVVTYAKIQQISATDKLLGRSTAGAGNVEEIACTGVARTLIAQATQALMRTTGLGATTVGGNLFTLANPSAVTWPRINADNSVSTRTAAETRTDLSLVPGTDVQAYDATLAALAAQNWIANALPIGSGVDTLTQVTCAANTFPARASTGNLVAKTITDFGLSLVDDADATAGRATLGLGTLATQNGTFSGTSSGTNTGDQTDITGNAGTVTVANEATDTTCFPLFGTAASGNLQPKTNASLTFDSSTGALGVASLQSTGSILVGLIESSGTNLTISRDISGAVSSNNVRSRGVIQSGVTTAASYYRSDAETAAAAFTLVSLRHFYAVQGTIGAGSAVTNQYGFAVDSSLTSGANNYGFYANIATAAARWNFYANGTAPNYFRGLTTFGDKFGYGTLSGVGGQVTQATSKSTGVTRNTVTGQITTHNAALAANTTVSFTLTNSTIEADDSIVIHRKSGGTAGAYTVWIDSVAAGSCVICLRNETAGSLSENVLLQFAVVRGAIA